jgi:hypothetical protein
VADSLDFCRISSTGHDSSFRTYWLLCIVELPPCSSTLWHCKCELLLRQRCSPCSSISLFWANPRLEVDELSYQRAKPYSSVVESEDAQGPHDDITALHCCLQTSYHSQVADAIKEYHRASINIEIIFLTLKDLSNGAAAAATAHDVAPSAARTAAAAASPVTSDLHGVA